MFDLYKTKPRTVKAVKVTEDNINDIKNNLEQAEKFGDYLFIEVGGNRIKAGFSSWIIKDKDQEIAVFSDKEFNNKFERQKRS